MKKLFLLLLLLTGAGWCSTVTISGNLTDAQGNPLNGVIRMQLPIMAQDITTNTQVTVSPVFYRVVNGVVQPGPPLYDVANLRPTGLYYITSVFDSAGNNVFNGNFYVTGASPFNLGTATPTNITTSNVSFANPQFLSVTVSSFQGIPVAGSTTYPCTITGLNAARAAIVSALSGLGGIIDARGCLGNISLGNGTITVDDAASQTPVRLLLGSGTWTFANTGSAHGFKITASGSSIIGPGPINLIINCTGTGMGDFVHAEPATGNSINAIEVAGFRIDAANCPNSIPSNSLSVRDPSSFHNLDLRNWLGTAFNIGPSTNGGALLAQGISVRDVYMQSGTGALTANSMSIVCNECEIGNNVKVIQTGTNPSAFQPIIIQPSVTPSGDGRRNHVFGTSVSCNNVANSIGILITAPAGATTGAQANMVGPMFAAENCTIGGKLTGADASHKAINNWFGFNSYTPSTSNVIVVDFATANWIQEFTNGNAGDITLTANSSGNEVMVHLATALADISDSGTGNSINQCINSATFGGSVCYFKNQLGLQGLSGFHTWQFGDGAITSAGHLGFVDITQGSGKTGFGFQTNSGGAGFTEGLFFHAITASRKWTMPDLSSGVPVVFSCGNTGSGSQTCAPAAATSNTQIYQGESTLAANTATITFPNAFTSTTSFFCVANDVTTRANPVQMVPASTTTATITNTTGATDVIQWQCIGQ